MNAIIKYILNMIPYMLISLPIIVIVRYIRVRAMHKHLLRTSIHHEIGIILFVVFLIGLASQTIIPKIEFGNTNQFIVGYGMGSINLIPFKVIIETYTAVFVDRYFNYFLINFIGNIVMFMPIGFFAPLLWENISFKKTVVIGLLSSLFIEICQLPQARGTDIDDIWINTLGCILGFGVYIILKKCIPLFVQKFKVVNQTK
ncbi:MAG: VanZ family protein [Mycoplasmatota bacterium]